MTENEPVKAAVDPPKKKKNYDGLAPLTFPSAICANCGGKMDFAPTRESNGALRGKISKALYYCDYCEYGFEYRPEHMAGTIVKYQQPIERRGRT